MSVLNLTKENFQETMGGDKPVLVKFWAPWCGFCRRLAPAFEKAAEQAGDGLLAAQLNIDEAPELAEQYGVELIPTLILFRGGQAAAQIVNPASKGRIDEFLRENIQA